MARISEESAVSNAARKARKRVGIAWVKAPKRPTRPYGRKPIGLGLVSRAEIMASLLVRGAL